MSGTAKVTMVVFGLSSQMFSDAKRTILLGYCPFLMSSALVLYSILATPLACPHQAETAAARALLVEMMADLDEEVAELFLMEEEVSVAGP